MMRYLKYIICLIILFPITVKGAVCDNSTRVRLQKIAQNITTSYDYVEENGNVTFLINFYNLNSEVYIVDAKNNRRYNYNGDTLTIGDFKSDTNYKFEIRSSNVLCDSSALYYLYVATPAYNSYYNDPICNGVNYKYCNKWQRNTLSYDEFIKDVENFKNKKNIIDDNNEEVKGIFDIILEFYVNNYYIVLPLLIVLSLVYIIIKSLINRKKNNLF